MPRGAKSACHLSRPWVAPRLKHSTLHRKHVSDGQPSNDGIRELAAPRRYNPMIAHRLVVSYTAFSPLLQRARYKERCAKGRLFSSTFTRCRQQLPFSEVGCPMLPGLSSRIIKMPAAEPGHCLLACKYSHFFADYM